MAAGGPSGSPGLREDNVAFCRSLPKAELHAHLHGSIRSATLVELLQGLDYISTSAEAQAVIKDVLPSPHRSLRDCFRIFDLIHAAVRDADAVRRITREYIEDCAADNIVYTEIRTTPRKVTEPGSPQHTELLASYGSLDSSLDEGTLAYCAAVILTLAECQASKKFDVLPRLLLSINRTSPLINAESAVAAALYLRDKVAMRSGDKFAILSQKDVPAGEPCFGPYVIGIDVSGDPTRGSAEAFVELLRKARSGGLKITVHAAEVMNVAETHAILDFCPDRLGHMCVLAPTTVKRLLDAETRIPIEVCPTSNALTLHLPSLHHHPTISPWLAAGYPFAICTDDQGVFNITLSEEYADVLETYGLSKEDVRHLAVSAFAHAFDDSKEFEALLGRVRS